jgi:hypothetical protein
MSFLSLPRINFAGFFEADVNTVNNDVRHFDAAKFESRFQTVQKLAEDAKGTIYNGWWNPRGTNAFRLFDCVVCGGADITGTPLIDDPILTLLN